MIRGARHVCVACREGAIGDDGSPLPPDSGPLFVQAEMISTLAGRLTRRYKFLRWPLLRGSIVLLESVELGSQGLRLSASVALRSTRPAASAVPDISIGSVPLITGGGALAGAPVSADHHLPTDEPVITAAVPTDAPVLDVSARRAARSAAFRLVSIFLLVIAARCLSWQFGWLATRGERIGAVAVAAFLCGMAVLFTQSQREESAAGAPQSLGEMAVGATMLLGLSLGVTVFFLIPSLLAGAFSRVLHAPWALNLLEGAIRIALFFGYLKLISRMENIHRLFQYHGAEHQAIHAHENGLDLTPENAARFPTIHPRCGTAFLAIVLVISVIVFAFCGWQAWWLRIILRIALLPIVGGVSYELLKWNSRRPNPVLHALVAPGLWFQKITTQPPTRSQQEVAIAAMQGVLQEEQSAAEAA